MNKKPAEYNDPHDTAALIKQARKARGMTQVELARRVGVTADYIYRIETAQRAPSLKVLAAIAMALHVSLDSLWIDNGSDVESEASQKQPDYVVVASGRLIQRAVREALKDELKDEYWDIRDVAEVGLGISYSYYREIARGAKTPSFELAAKIAVILGRSLDELVFEDTRKNPD